MTSGDIAGYWSLDQAPHAPDRCRHMLRALGAARDVRIASPEPWIAFGGVDAAVSDAGVAAARLDDRAALQRGSGLADQSDAELLLAAWASWGERAFDRVLGDFAIAAWDARDRTLVLARDALGFRPLFFARGADFLAFASAPRAIHALDLVPRRADAGRLARHIAGVLDTGTASYHHGIERVRPGECVRPTERGVARHFHWQPSLTPLRRRPADAAAELRALLMTAVASRLDGGTTGTQLSAGLDSTAITGTAALVARDRPVDAFTAVPTDRAETWREDRLLDESGLAGTLAGAYPNLRHHVIRPAAHALDLLDQAWRIYDQPMPNPVNQGWVTAINDAARGAGNRVLLIGQFGNLGFSAAGSTLAERAVSRLKRLVTPAAAADEDPGFLRPEWAGALRGDDPDEAGTLALLRHLDPGPVLRGVRAGWDLDWRDPLGDRTLLEFCLTLPPPLRVVAGDPRGLTRLVLAPLLPAPLLAERRRGFQAGDWLVQLRARTARLQALVDMAALSTTASGLLDIDAMRQAVRALPDVVDSPAVERRYRGMLLRALATAHFALRAESD